MRLNFSYIHICKEYKKTQKYHLFNALIKMTPSIAASFLYGLKSQIHNASGIIII